MCSTWCLQWTWDLKYVQSKEFHWERATRLSWLQNIQAWNSEDKTIWTCFWGYWKLKVRFSFFRIQLFRVRLEVKSVAGLLILCLCCCFCSSISRYAYSHGRRKLYFQFSFSPFIIENIKTKSKGRLCWLEYDKTKEFSPEATGERQTI